MDKMFTLGLILSATDNMGPILGKATEKLNAMDKKTQQLGSNLLRMGTATYATGMGITAGLGGIYNTYSEVAKAQGEIATLGFDEKGINTISKAAMSFSNQWAGTAAPDFIRASYDIKSGISSLSDTAVAEYTKLSALTAAATKSTTGEMTTLFALGHGIFRDQFGSDNEFGQQFSGAIATAVKAFRTDGSDLSQGMSNIGATAHKMGVTLQEELAIIGMSKGAFASASEAGSGYRAFLDGASNAQKKLGMDFTDSKGRMLPIVDILNMLKERYGDVATLSAQSEIKDAFGSTEAVKTINALIDKTDELTASEQELYNSMKKGTEQTEAMAKAAQRGQAFTRLGQQLGNLGVAIGSTFAPAADKLADVIGSVTMAVASWTEEHPKLAGAIGTLVGVIGLGAMGLGSFGIIAGTIIKLLPVLSLGFSAAGSAVTFLGRALMMNPIGQLVTVIAGAAYLIYDNWEMIKQAFKAGAIWIGVAVDKAKGFVGSAWAGIKEAFFSFTPLRMVIKNWGPISGFFSGLWDGVTSVFSGAWDGIKMFFAWSPLWLVINGWQPAIEWIADKIGWVSSAASGIADFFGFGGEASGDGSAASAAGSATTSAVTKLAAAPVASARAGTVTNTYDIKVDASNAASNVDVTAAVKQAMMEHERDKRDRSMNDGY